MKERIFFGLLVGLLAGFFGLWGLEIQTLAGSVVFVSAFALGMAVIFAISTEKTVDRITAFFTHFWP